jgi:hypothetical protein
MECLLTDFASFPGVEDLDELVRKRLEEVLIREIRDVETDDP